MPNYCSLTCIAILTGIIGTAVGARINFYWSYQKFINHSNVRNKERIENI
jgi:hypothetical protein